MNRATPLAITAVAAMLFVAACGSSSSPPASAAAPGTTSAAGPSTSAGQSANGSTTPASGSSTPSSGSGASASPSTAGASPSPSAGSDTAAAFKAALSEPGFSATASVKGEVDITDHITAHAGGTVALSGSYAVTGTLEISAPDSHSTVLVRMPGGQTQETVVSEGRTYTRTGSGPWFVSPAAAGSSSSADLTSFLRALASVEDHGLETKSGRQLHHLTMSPGQVVPPALFGFAGSSIKNPVITLEFWAREDGTLAVMQFKGAWGQVSGSSTSDVSMTVEYDFDRVGQTVTIAAPDVVWTMFASKRYHYSIGHPSDWDEYPARSAKLSDEFDSPDGAFVTAYRYPSKGVKLNTLVRYAANTYLKRHFTHFALESVTSTTVAGMPAREIRAHGTYNGHKQYLIFILALRGSYFYEVDVFDVRGHEAADRALAAQEISTVVFR